MSVKFMIKCPYFSRSSHVYESSQNAPRLIFHGYPQCCHTSLRRVHWAHWVYTIVTPLMDDHDSLPFIKWLVAQNRVRHIPPSLKWKWRAKINSLSYMLIERSWVRHVTYTTKETHHIPIYGHFKELAYLLEKDA